MQKELWTLQRQSREILNRTIQIAYHWDYMDGEHFKKTGQHFNVFSETGSKVLPGYIYKYLKTDVSNFAMGNVTVTIQKAWKKYNKFKRDIQKGEMSLPSFKSDQPLIIRPANIKIYENDNKPEIRLTLFFRSL